MTLLETLKHFTINIDGDDEPLIEIDYEYNDFCKNQYDSLIHNLKCIGCERDFDVLSKTDIDDKFLQAMKDDTLNEMIGLSDYDNQMLLYAAWLTSRDLLYDEIEDDEWEDMYVDTQEYEFVFNDFDFKYTYETDIDMT